MASGDDDSADPAIRVTLDALLADRHMTLTELADRVGITVVNLSILKNGRARAIRFTTLASLCEVLGCQPADLLSYPSAPGSPGASQRTPSGGTASTAEAGRP